MRGFTLITMDSVTNFVSDHPAAFAIAVGALIIILIAVLFGWWWSKPAAKKTSEEEELDKLIDQVNEKQS